MRGRQGSLNSSLLAEWSLHAFAGTSINSGRDFQGAMYWDQYARNGCIRLLNSTHQIGCASRRTVEAPIQAYNGSTLNLKGIFAAYRNPA
jgi:hypothetical protein